MSVQADVVEQFHGVYLLYCKNPEFLGKTYIGYTVDPNRRIKQHNKGRFAGGARKTSNKGPWSMVLIIHGFPNNISALRFEWAWQMPLVSRRLACLPGIKKTRKENLFQYNIRILSEMLRIGPWCRLPLTVRWLVDEFATDFFSGKSPPTHMPICYGPVVSKKLPNTGTIANTLKVIEVKDNSSLCYLCDEIIVNDMSKITCLASDCCLTTHSSCLAAEFLEPGEYVPIQGHCPKCNGLFLWGDLIRKARGCYQNVNDEDVSYSSESEFEFD